MDFQWHELSNNKYRYKTAAFTDNLMGKRFNRLNHEYMLIAVASFGGPIAITSDKTQILTLREQDPTIDYICLFSNQGQITSKVKLNNPFQNIIIHLEFIQDQYLLVLFQKGQEWLIDPHTQNVKRFNLIGLYENEEIKQAKVFQNGFAILTNQNRFLFVRNAFQPQLIEFVNCHEELKQTRGQLFWTVFSPKLIISQKVQLHLCHPECGIIRIVQDESKRLFYDKSKNEHVIESKLPNIKGPTYISELSPNKKMVVYFMVQPLYKQNPMDQIANMKKKKDKNAPEVERQPYGYSYKIVFAPSLTSDTISSNLFYSYELPYVKAGVHLNINGSPLSIKWCGNKSIVIQFFNHDIYMYSIDGDYSRIEKDRSEKNKWTYLKQEMDGVRIITKQQNKIMRQIPSSYISIFQSFSEEPGALLYSAYEAFEDQAPLQDDQIRKEKKKLAAAVQQCIRASRFELNFQIITKLMKSATYGKAFLPPNMISNNLIFDTTKMLRLLSCLRNKHRYITFEQLQSLSDDMLIKILLRYREHYLAFEIYNYLKKDQNFRIKIFTDWACCKVENHQASQEQVCEQIRQKLQNQKGISFTEIAHKAIEVQRSELALRLLRYEPSLSKKVPLLLWMGAQQTSEESCYKFYEKALEEALRSRDLNLLFLAIRKIMTSQRMGRDKIFDMFSTHKQGRYALINYFRLFDTKSLLEYNQFYLNDNQAVIMIYLKKAFEEKKYEVSQELFQCAVEVLKNLDISKQDWRKMIIPKVYGNLSLFIKERPQIKYKNDKVKPAEISKQLEVFLSKRDGAGVDDVKDFYKIHDRRVIMGQIKVFIDQRKYEDLESFVQKNQKKYNIPVELVADILLKKRQETWAMRMMARMPEKHKQEQYMLLQRIGRNKEAIDLAVSRKDVDTLEQIQGRIIDPNLLAYVNQKINLLRRR